MSHFLAVGIGGGLGSIARYWLSGIVYRYSGGGFPFGTMAVNVLGSLLIGVIVGMVEYKQMFEPNVRAFLLAGVLGGFTTFSAFSLETFALLRDQQQLLALANVTVNVIAGLAAVAAGWFLARLM